MNEYHEDEKNGENKSPKDICMYMYYGRLRGDDAANSIRHIVFPRRNSD